MTTRTDSGRVLTQSELVAEVVDKLLDQLAIALYSNTNTDEAYDAEELRIKKLYSREFTRYVIEQRGEDFFRGEKVGRLQGHKEAGVMFLAAFEAELRKKTFRFLQNPDDLTNTLMVVEDAAKRAVEAINKSTEAKG